MNANANKFREVGKTRKVKEFLLYEVDTQLQLEKIH